MKIYEGRELDVSLLKYSDDVYNSDNPFVDLLVYNLKILCFNSVIKDSYEADNNETLNSIKKSDIYIACVEKRAEISTFSYIPEIILKAVGMTTDEINTYINKYYDSEKTRTSSKKSSMYNDKIYTDITDSYPVFSIPEKYHESIVKLMIPWYIENYNEENNYYRMLLGMPPLGDPGVSIKEYEYLIPDYIKNEYDEKAIFFHELGPDVNKSLEELGILDVIRTEYPQYKYLNYLTKDIDLYTARTKLDMQLIYTANLDSSIVKLFEDTYNRNREYVLTTVYTKAMEIQSEYYHSFMIVYTILITFIDILTEVQHHIVTKDILDRRCIKYIFSMYGVPYFKIIPYKYQERLCKNINKILKYKSSDQGILDIVNLFGFENIEVWKWCLVKNYKLNGWGEYDYKEYRALTCSKNTLISSEIIENDFSNSEKPEYYDEISKYYNSSEVEYDDYKVIRYPFPYYLEKGNILLVEVDGKILNEEQYVIFDYDKIHFTENVENSTIKYRFYYDNNTVGSTEGFPCNDNLYVRVYNTNEYENVLNDDYSFDLSNTNLSEFFINDNYQFNVLLNGKWLRQNQYSVDYDNKIVSLETEYDKYNDIIDFVFIQSKTFYNIYEMTTKTITDGKCELDEPFDGYIENGNGLLITKDENYIEYNIEDGFIYVDDQYEGQDIDIHFVYSNMSAIPQLSLREQKVIITTTDPYQTLFNIEFPVNNYNASGYKVYIKTLGWWLPSTYYSMVGENVININNECIAPQYTGRELEIYFVYVPEDRTIQKNIRIKNDYIVAERDYQKTFNIDLPFDDYLDKGNLIVFDMEGIYLKNEDIEEGYTIIDKTSTSITISIENRDIRPKKGQKINITYYYYLSTHDYQLGIDIQRLGIVENDSSVYQLDYPFYPYLKTNHNVLFQAGKKVIDESNIEYIDQFHIRFIGLDANEYSDFIEGNELVAIYFYNKWYLHNKPQEFIIETREHMVTNGQVELDIPCHQYIENQWPYLIVDENNVVLDDYEIYDNTLYTHDFNRFNALYIYMIKDGYIEEDISREAFNSDLYFFRSIVGEHNSIKNCKDKSKWKSYDSITLMDKWWDGLYYGNNNHESIKNSIYNEKFNYERTKYYQIASVINLSEFTAQIGYFYGMLYNDICVTDNIKISVPLLSSNHKFKLSHLFIYMSILTYIFNGYEDQIIDIASSNMWIQGFNFDADLDSLKEYIRKNHRHYSDYHIWDYGVSTDIDNLVHFVDTYKTNYGIRQTILRNITLANTYREYKVWKKLYDGLLLTKINMTYFTKSDGNMATTYTEFLEDQDKILYDSVVSIKNMNDKESIEDEILNIINNVIYCLQEYINGNECKYTFSMVVSKDSASVLKYITTLIEFFKSYKVSLLSRSDTLEVGNSYELDTYMRPIDDIDLSEIVNNRDYMQLSDYQSSTEYTVFNDGHIETYINTIMDDNHIQYNGYIKEDVFIQQVEKGMVYKYFEGSLIIDKIEYIDNLPIEFTLESTTIYSQMKILTINLSHRIDSELMNLTTNIIFEDYENELFYINLYLKEPDILKTEGQGKTIIELYNSTIAIIPENDYGTLVVTIRKIAEEEGSLEAFFKESKIQTIPEQVSFVDDEGYFITDNFNSFSADNTDLSLVTINGGLCKNNGLEKNFENMFSGCTKLSSISNFYIKQNMIDAYNNTSAGDIIMDNMFDGCTSLSNGLEYVDTIQNLSMRDSFRNCTLLSDLPSIRSLFGNMDLYETFYGCISLQYLPDIYFSEYDVSLILGAKSLPQINLEKAFYGCTHLIQNTSSISRGFIFTFCKVNMNNTFENCVSLEEAIPIKMNNRAELTLTDTYKNCTSLIYGGNYTLSESSILTIHSIFSGCHNLSDVGYIQLSDFSKVTLDNTYAYCDGLLKVDKLLSSCTTATTILRGTFNYCTSLKYVVIDMSSVSSINDIFTGCVSLESVIFINPRENVKRSLNHLTLDNNTLSYTITIKEENS